jgi:predicted NBD/HSP70 family sugar kinase
VLNPDVVLIGGGMTALKQYYMPTLLETMDTYILPVAGKSEH